MNERTFKLMSAVYGEGYAWREAKRHPFLYIKFRGGSYIRQLIELDPDDPRRLHACTDCIQVS